MAASSVIFKTLRWTARTIFVLLNNLYCIPTYVVWCLLLHPVYFINPDWYWLIEGHFFHWLLTMVAFWSYSAGYYIVESGDIIDSVINEETLILANHQSTSDVPLLMHAFSTRKNLLEKLNWIMDAVFQYTNFGVVSTLHGDFFINAGRSRRDASLRDLETFLKGAWLPRKRKWLVLFPEGGFLRKRKEASKRYAERMNLPNLEFVTLPRLGALQTIINTLVPPKSSDNSDINAKTGSDDFEQDRRLKYIVDMTIAYPDGQALDLGSIVTGYVPSCNVYMHYKIYRINEIPHESPDELQAWLYNLYIEKNNMLGHYYKTGVWNPDLHKACLSSRPQSLGNCSSENITEKSNKEILTNSDDEDSRQNPATTVVNDDCLHQSCPSSNNANEDALGKELLQEGINMDSSDNECNYESLDEGETEVVNVRKLHLDLLRVGLLHVMFIASTAIHCVAFRVTYQYMFGETT